jgi:hypothetical protein
MRRDPTLGPVMVVALGVAILVLLGLLAYLTGSK